MSASRLPMEDVVLVEVRPGEPAGAAARSHDPAARPPGNISPNPRGRRWWPAVAGITLALLVLINAVVSQRSERGRLAALAGVPGILAPLSAPVAEIWRSEVNVGPGPAASAGVLVGLDRRRDGRVDVVGLDPRSGDTSWRVEARPAGTIEGWAACAAPSPGAGAPVVVCVVAMEVVVTAENTSGYVYYPTRARLLVVDSATGALLADGPTDPSTTVAALGEDLVTSRLDGDGRVHVSRTDARGGAARWTFTSPSPLPVNDFRQRRARVTAVDGLVMVDAGPTWVLSSDGVVLSRWVPDARTELGGRVAVLHRGRLILEPVEITQKDVPGSRVVDVSRATSATVAGHPVSTALDDGSLGELVLMESTDGQLVAYEGATARARWTTPDARGGQLAIIGGRVLRTDAGELQSLDGRTGEVVWATSAAPSAKGPIFSDGRVVLLTRQDPSRGLALAAYGLDDGRLRWSTDIPDDLELFAVDGRLYGWSDRGLVGLG